MPPFDFVNPAELDAELSVHDMEIALHNVCGPVGTAANIQRAAGIPNYRILKYFNDFADSSDDGQTTPT